MQLSCKYLISSLKKLGIVALGARVFGRGWLRTSPCGYEKETFVRRLVLIYPDTKVKEFSFSVQSKQAKPRTLAKDQVWKA
jgi:hypothetical protein